MAATSSTWMPTTAPAQRVSARRRASTFGCRRAGVRMAREARPITATQAPKAARAAAPKTPSRLLLGGMRAQAPGADARLHQAALDHDPPVLQIWQEAPIRAPFRVTDVVSVLRALAADRAFPGHELSFG